MISLTSQETRCLIPELARHSPELGVSFSLRRMNLRDEMTSLAKHAKAAARELAQLSTSEKNQCLLAMADALEAQKVALKDANAIDMAAGGESGLSAAMLDRLKL